MPVASTTFGVPKPRGTSSGVHAAPVPAESPRDGVGDLLAHRDGSAAVVPAQFLTTTGRRGSAAGAILAHSPIPAQCALTAADVLDLTCRAILGGVGVIDPDDARAVMATLWVG